MRIATKSDGALLSGFTCASSDHHWDVEVDEQIRRTPNGILDWWSYPDADDDARLLLMFDQAGTLASVGAHHKMTFNAGSDLVLTRQIELIAVALVWQGAGFHTSGFGPDGEARPLASRVMMDALILDIQGRGDQPPVPVSAKVHRRNERSLWLMTEYGLTREIACHNPDYVYRMNE